MKLKALRWSALISVTLAMASFFLFQNCAHKKSAESVTALEIVPEGTENHGIMIAAGSGHTCVTNRKGEVFCWGKNRLGLSGNPNHITDSLTPTKQTGLENVVQLATGNDTNCALTRGGEVYCWGSNGNWGLGMPGVLSGPTPVKVLTGVKHIDGDYAHFCAVKNEGTVECWGNSQNVASIVNSATPTPVAGLTDVEKVNVAFSHACALTKTKKLKCWGANTYKLIEAAEGLEDLASVDAGLSHSCALKSDGSVLCWGQSDFGQSGSLESKVQVSPLPIVLPAPAKKIVAGANTSCALLATGTVSCWGNNILGQFGLASTLPRVSAEPSLAAGISEALDLAMGADHACVVLKNRSVRCWGVNAQGQLGNGSLALTYSASPLEVAGLPRL